MISSLGILKHRTTANTDPCGLPWDADAIAYLTASGIRTTFDSSVVTPYDCAVNKLVSDLKTSGLWNNLYTLHLNISTLNNFLWDTDSVDEYFTNKSGITSTSGNLYDGGGLFPKIAFPYSTINTTTPSVWPFAVTGLTSQNHYIYHNNLDVPLCENVGYEMSVYLKPFNGQKNFRLFLSAGLNTFSSSVFPNANPYATFTIDVNNNANCIYVPSQSKNIVRGEVEILTNGWYRLKCVTIPTTYSLSSYDSKIMLYYLDNLFNVSYLGFQGTPQDPLRPGSYIAGIQLISTQITRTTYSNYTSVPIGGNTIVANRGYARIRQQMKYNLKSTTTNRLDTYVSSAYDYNGQYANQTTGLGFITSGGITSFLHPNFYLNSGTSTTEFSMGSSIRYRDTNYTYGSALAGLDNTRTSPNWTSGSNHYLMGIVPNASDNFYIQATPTSDKGMYKASCLITVSGYSYNYARTLVALSRSTSVSTSFLRTRNATTNSINCSNSAIADGLGIIFGNANSSIVSPTLGGSCIEYYTIYTGNFLNFSNLTLFNGYLETFETTIDRTTKW